MRRKPGKACNLAEANKTFNVSRLKVGGRAAEPLKC